VRTRPTVSAVFDTVGGSPILVDTVRVLVDGRDVTADANVTQYLVSYQPTTALTTGEHQVVVTGRDRAGNEFRQSWTFVVGDDAGLVQSFTHDAKEKIEPGDVVTVTLVAQPGSVAVFSIGDVVVERPLHEVTAGRYVGEYTVRRGDAMTNQPVRARIRTPDGQVYTVQADRPIGIEAGPPPTPTIVSHQANAEVKSPLVLRGTAAPNTRVQVQIEYTTMVLGAVRMGGSIAEVVVDVNEKGQWETRPISLDTLLRGSDTQYTVRVIGIGAEGVRSEPTVLRLRG
jgi:hypothetical protein